MGEKFQSPQQVPYERLRAEVLQANSRGGGLPPPLFFTTTCFLRYYHFEQLQTVLIKVKLIINNNVPLTFNTQSFVVWQTVIMFF